MTIDEGACFTCYDQLDVAWNADATLQVTIPADSNGELLGTLRFGTDKGGLSPKQLAQVRINGRQALLDRDGWLKSFYPGLSITIR